MSGRAGSTTTEAAGSHSLYLSQPTAVADLIKQAESVRDQADEIRKKKATGVGN